MSSRWEGIDEFVAVAESGQFTAAAERLGVSSSHISRQIARLEERLQTRLLYRSTRRVTLSEAGQTFLQHCQRLQDGREEALRAMGDLASEPKGLLRMTCAVAYGERFIVPLVTRFMALYPQLRVKVELSNHTLDLLQEGMDLAIRLGRLADSRLVAARLAPRRMYLCASPAYLERYGRPHSLSELARHNCLVGSSDLWALQQDGREISQRVQGNWRCNSGQAVLDAALQGIGLCQLPDYYVLEHLNTGALVSLLEAHQPPNTAVWALYPQQRHLSPKVRRLVDYLKEGLAGLPEYRQG
ncbi:LysR family transcriptional regulator [Pseudomonas monteilii]|uniref:LysR family transcriptional regulator n=1 Tax=Pseudomonas TaxID=286 RepID=UPI00048F1933|nr:MULTISPECIES: LysR family transcriptional regulator [Pseudomonas]MBA1315841.1 LysR family transcriptional regulator [Pseudomonas monteilii]MBA6090158.1 LysR family transcriptional regulator [Pseudomonas monteilii]MCE1019499.1 LysR family transcriptional regulator [Pseudomonas monteilii]MCE1036102.1 LysR family transcriptional regulator [Pseudomonas monteilii]MCE1090183.1 LysR family transcriptional regulator [Pseudomonas monteilii]